MARVRLQGVSKTFERVHALRALDLEIRDGEFFTLLGPSGCGKTTLLRLIAGLERPSSGEIYIGERRVTPLAPKDRDLAMVFQDYALYPHMSVRQNLAFPLEARKRPRAAIDATVGEVAGRLQIRELLARRARQLSGGQQQRVALGRAMVRSPKAFLMDEPLSNLDAKLRLQMRAELKRLQHDLRVTTVYVTHDQEEAMTMSDRVAVLRDGLVQQCAAADDVYRYPANRWVAEFVGNPPMNVFEATRRRDGDAVVVVPEGAPAARFACQAEGPGERVLAGIRPEHLVVHRAPVSGALPGRVYVVEPAGDYAILTVRTEAGLLKVKITGDERPANDDRIHLTALRSGLHLFSIETGERIGSRATCEGHP